MTFIRNRLVVAAVVAASSIAVPASASAGTLSETYQSDAAQGNATATQQSSGLSDAAQGNSTATQQSGRLSDAAQGNSTAPARQPFPPAGFRGGDMPAEHPGMGPAPEIGPTTIEVVRPERTIVRDVDEALPLILSSTALLLVLTGAGVALVRIRMEPRPGRSS
jgi:hypothetical protein